MKNLTLVAVVCWLGCAASFAEPVGRLEVRPTIVAESGAFETRNEVQAGYAFRSDRRLFYAQNINSNSSGASLPDGRVELDLNNLWRIGNTVSLDYQPRVHVPTDPARRDLGMITEIRNQVNVTKTLSNQAALVVSWIPIVHAYSKSGGVVKGEKIANPLLENRVEVAGVLHPFSEKVIVTLPLKFYQTRYTGFEDGAKFNNSWGFSLTAKPEVFYQFTPNLLAGVAFETNNLVSGDLKSATFGDGIKQGVAQAAVIVAL